MRTSLWCPVTDVAVLKASKPLLAADMSWTGERALLDAHEAAFLPRLPAWHERHGIRVTSVPPKAASGRDVALTAH
jgi:hypothetical protein